MAQSNINEWVQSGAPEENDTDTPDVESGREPKPKSESESQTQTEPSDNRDSAETVISSDLEARVEKFKEARIRPIPREERYPVWWGRLRGYNQSPQTLGELDYEPNKRYSKDDREECTWEQHFAEVHTHYTE
jgi:hypothetical protein